MSKYPFTHQTTTRDDVASCLAMISRYYNITWPIKDIRSKIVESGLGKESLARVIMNASSGNYTVTVVGGAVDSATFPLIAYRPQNNTCVVVWAKGRRCFIVGDPAVGTMRVSAQFMIYPGVQYIRLDPCHSGNSTSIGVLSSPTTRQMLADVVPSGNGLRLSILTVLAMITALLNGYLALSLPVALQHPQALIWSWLLTYFVGTTVLGVGTSWFSARARLQLSMSISSRLNLSVPTMDCRYYSYGDGFTRYQDLQTIVRLLIHIIRDIPYAILITCIAFWYLYNVGPLVMWALLGTVIVLGSALLPLIGKIQSMAYQNRLNLSRFMDDFRKLWGGRIAVESRFWNRYLVVLYRQSVLSIPSGAFLNHLPMIGLLIIVLLLRRTLQWHDVLTLLMLTNYVSSGIRRLFTEYTAWRTTKPSLTRLSEVLTVLAGQQDNQAAT